MQNHQPCPDEFLRHDGFQMRLGRTHGGDFKHPGEDETTLFFGIGNHTDIIGSIDRKPKGCLPAVSGLIQTGRCDRHAFRHIKTP